MYSENDGKCIATYLSSATWDECITPPFSAVEAFLKFTDFANAAAAADCLFLLLCIRHASKTLLKINLLGLQQRWFGNENMTIYTDKFICSGNILCVSVIRVNTLEKYYLSKWLW